ncbi:hypothetical protein EV401DRAFT_1892856 [Pisolithus croceorrhizus]|nr:hypothetical protein EV401DRAFT_1892856 [Pisolithus croceorrhizus]
MNVANEVLPDNTIGHYVNYPYALSMGTLMSCSGNFPVLPLVLSHHDNHRVFSMLVITGVCGGDPDVRTINVCHFWVYKCWLGIHFTLPNFSNLNVIDDGSGGSKVDDQSGVKLDTPLCCPIGHPSSSWYLTGHVCNLMGKPTRWEAMQQDLCGRVPKCKVNDITHKTEVVKSSLKSFGQVPKCKAEDDTVGLPTKRRVAESFSIHHSAVKSLPMLLGRVPKHKVEGDATRLPLKRRVVKSSTNTHDMPQECHLWWLPNELLSDIADLLDTDSLRRLSQVSKLLQGISGHRYLASVGFKLLIVGWLDVNEANCEALPVWMCIAFRAVHTLWFTSS